MKLSRQLSSLSAAFAASLPRSASAGPTGGTGSPALQNILMNTHRSSLYSYPTDFTRGIIPKYMHSHNDYWRDVPFYSAISYGAVSVEGDVWLINGTLHVGHEESALTDERTLDSLYIQPILDTLHRENPSTPFVTEPTKNGIFDTDSGQTLYLYVDMKTDGAETFTAVHKALAPLRDGGWLTTYEEGKGMKPAPVTVIGTGNTPLSSVANSDPRYIFYDAPLTTLASISDPEITSHISITATADFQGTFGTITTEGLSDDVKANITKQLKHAHDRGILGRYWDLPAWPIGTRNAVWRDLVDLGIDLLNVDDLAGAADFWWERG